MSTDQRPTPEWIARYIQSYSSGEAHAFCVTGDVEGLAFEGVSQRRLLLSILLERRDVVAIYSLAEGIAIQNPAEVIEIAGARPRNVTRLDRAKELIGEVEAPTSGNKNIAALMGSNATTTEDPFEAARSPLQALALLRLLLRGGERVAVIVEHADLIVPSASTSGKATMGPADRTALALVLELARDQRIDELSNVVFLWSRALEELHADVRAADSGWSQIAIRLPHLDERREYLSWYLATRENEGDPIPLNEDLTTIELANNTAGLSLRNIEDVLLVAAKSGGTSRSMIKEYKDRVITSMYSEVAEMIDPLVGGFESLGGMARLKTWAYTELISPVREQRTNDVPKGVLLVGPPGTGKTFFVRALAREVGFNAVMLNASKILGGIVGESEAKLAKFLGFVRSMAPCLVFVDEFDQGDMGKRGNDSGNPVASNLFNAFLQFMSDETLRGRVMMVFASNRPDLLDSAILRFGRMDAIVPVLLPNEQERRSIAVAQARAQGIGLIDSELDLIASGTAKYSAADIGAIVRKVRLLKRSDETEQQPVARALRAIRPATLAQADYYTDLALAACNDRDLLPEEYADRFDERQASVEQNEAVGAATSSRRARAW